MNRRAALGKLSALDELERQAGERGFAPLPVSVAHEIAAGQLPWYHDDPFYRMLIAQEYAEELAIVARDKCLADYNEALLPARHVRQRLPKM